MSQGSAANPVRERRRTARHGPAAAGQLSAAGTPPIPDKLYFRIGEVARLCGVQTSVLRFWETEFPQLHPGKGSSGQRLFRRRDVETALRIRHLLYAEGYTIPGARQLLRSGTQTRTTDDPAPPAPLPSPAVGELLFPLDQLAAQHAPALPLGSRLETLQQQLRELHSLLSRSSPAPRRTRSSAAASPAATLFDPPCPAVH